MKKAPKESTPTKKSPASAQPKSSILPSEDKTRIFIRVRPLLNTEEWNNSLTVKDNNHIRMIKSDFESVNMRFEGIFSPSFLQKDIFSILEPSIKGFLNGESHSFFAYGQTGAGKTYTMMGDFEEKATDYSKFLTNDSRGILPRALSEILQYLQNRKCRLWAAFYEIYNDKIFDLLNAKSRQKKGGLDFRENTGGANVILDLQQFEINSVNDMLDCLRVGIQNRITGSTHGNQKSSRSHSIFQLKLVQADPQDPNKTIISQLKIIDLAGSEKFIIPQNLTPEERELRITELTSINGSLSTLGLCVSALTEPNRSHIPLRNSKLTRVLSDTLNGSSKITFIVCISPSKESNNETLSTLQFANRAKKIVLEGRPTSKASEAKKVSSGQLYTEHGLLQEMCNIDIAKKNIPLELEIQQLRQQNEELKDQLKRMERSYSPSPVKQYASTGRNVARRSVSPISTTRPSKNLIDSQTPTKKGESKARTPTSFGKEIEVKTVNRNPKISTVSSNRALRTNTEPQYETQAPKSPLRTKSGMNNEYLLETQNEEELTPKQRIYHSADLRKGIKKEEPKPNAYSKFRVTSTPVDEASPLMGQQRLTSVSSPNRQRTPDYRDQPSGGSHLCEWGVYQDSRCLRENEQIGLPEISAILPTQFNSCSSSETEGILGAQTEPMRRIKEENNVTSHFLTSKIQGHYGNGLQRINTVGIDDSSEVKSSMDFGGEEIIKEFNRKLCSVQELNQQHRNLVQNLSSKIAMPQSNGRKGESRSASKSPNHFEKQNGKNEPRRTSQSPTKTPLNNVNGYNSTKHEGFKGQKSPDTKQFVSVQGKFDSGACIRLGSSPNVGSITTTNTTGYSEKKSEQFFESKSIMDIISKHWETYKDNIK